MMELDVAAYGWLDEAWAASYPEDMPLEWRLDYYANEFRSVVVPGGHWQERAEEALQEWVEEAHERFTFYWELESRAPTEQLLALYRRRPDLPPPGGWLLRTDAFLDEALRESLTSVAPLSICRKAGECVGGVRVFTVAEDADLRRLKGELDALKEEGAEAVVLVVMPSPAAGVNLERLQTLCQLYGG